jgi:hypothetical protein
MADLFTAHTSRPPRRPRARLDAVDAVGPDPIFRARVGSAKPAFQAFERVAYSIMSRRSSDHLRQFGIPLLLLVIARWSVIDSAHETLNSAAYIKSLCAEAFKEFDSFL